jgi:hypothetical protein
MHWNGSAWAIQPTASPNGATSTTLNAVTCPTLKSCFAVGDYTTSGGTKSFVQHWNGTNWGIQESPNPSPATSTALYGVACPLPQSCFAVGAWFQAPNTKTLVAHWNGSVWGLLASPSPSGTTAATLNAVSCPLPQSCFAVGNSSNASVSKGLVSHWNGKLWGLQGSPSGGANTVLTGVACPVSSSCFAVGFPAAQQSVIEHWNGTLWGRMGSPHPGTSYNRLFGVACPSTRICFAVGSFANSGASSFAIRYR